MPSRLKDFLMQTLLRLFAALLALSALGCATSRPSLPTNSTRVPMRLFGNLPFVKVEIAGRQHEFLLDTGASDCVVTPDLARSLGLPISREKVMVKSAAGDHVPIPLTVLPAMRIGASEFRNVACFVHDCSNIRQTFSNLEGVVGFNIFSKALLTLDYPRREVVISPWVPLQRGEPDSVEMRMGSGVPQIPVRSARRAMFVDVDSGSTGGMEIDPYRLGVGTTAAPQPGGLSTSISKTYRTGMARVAGPLFIGRVELDSPIVEVTRGEPRIGGEILQNLILTFDQPSRLAHISFGTRKLLGMGASHKLVSPSRVGTGVGFDRNWNVHDIVPGSAAARAGIRTGDQCVLIMGRPAVEWEGSYSDLLATAQFIDYRFFRKGRSYDVRVPVLTQVQ